jgi:glycosylphosphatidylinositol transamidase
MSFAKFCQKSSYWSRDIIFLVTDQGNYGSYVWLEAYHGQKPSKGIVFDSLKNSAGSIISAINLEFDGKSTDLSIEVHPSNIYLI